MSIYNKNLLLWSPEDEEKLKLKEIEDGIRCPKCHLKATTLYDNMAFDKICSRGHSWHMKKGKVVEGHSWD